MRAQRHRDDGIILERDHKRSWIMYEEPNNASQPLQAADQAGQISDVSGHRLQKYVS